MSEKMEAGLYIHVPFCVRKCPYCAFYSIPLDSDIALDYVGALKREMDLALEEPRWKEEVFSTIYLGGGTPTTLKGGQIEEILRFCFRSFRISSQAEITVEANPGTLDEKKIQILRDCGVNRLSLGMQSFNDDLLKTLGRIHNAREGKEAFSLARNTDFDNLNIDLIFAIPGQTLEDWKETLRAAVGLRPEHISAYSLTIEPGTPFERAMFHGSLILPSANLEAGMYEWAISYLKGNDYEHYEISNFARKSDYANEGVKSHYRSRHNQIYWQNGNYLGLGSGAHSHFQGERWMNKREVVGYVETLKAGKRPIEWGESLLLEKQMSETIFLALRTREGLSFVDFQHRYKKNLREEAEFWSIVEKFQSMGFVDLFQEKLTLTPKGMMLADSIASELMLTA